MSQRAETLEEKVARLLKKTKRLEKTIASKDETISGLKQNLRAIEIISRSPAFDEQNDEQIPSLAESSTAVNSLPEENDCEEDEDEELPEPLYDDIDFVYRCLECSFEVCDGICTNCQERYSYEIPPENDEGQDFYSSVMTEDTFMQSDRLTQPRGTTPILEDAAYHAILSRPRTAYRRSGLEAGSERSPEEYAALIGRGATHAMIEQFRLEFTEEEGIVAWADETLFQEFTTSVMVPGDQWKIHLGRRICLSYDDIDGSVFIEDLIDEIMHCPRPDRWATVKRKGIWYTRPVEFPRDANGDDNDVDIDSDGSLVDNEGAEGQWYKDGGYGDDDDGEEMYEEDWRYENEKEMDKNPLMVFDEYDEKDDETDDDEEMEILEQFMEEAMESDTDWDAEDPTKKEEERMSDTEEEEEEKENEGDDGDGDGDGVTATGINDEALGTAVNNIGQGEIEANVLGVEDGGEDEDELDLDEPGSDWDSNDGIE